MADDEWRMADDEWRMADDATKGADDVDFVLDSGWPVPHHTCLDGRVSQSLWVLAALKRLEIAAACCPNLGSWPKRCAIEP